MDASDRHPAPASRIGAEIRAARRSLGWETPQLAQSLRIRQSYLEAIEGGRVAELPGTTYALGFVRAYAAALGLDADEVARRFREEATEVNGKPALRFPAPVPRRGVPAGALILVGLVILAGAYAGWYSFTSGRPTPVETVPPIPDRLAAAVEKPAPSPQVASILPGAAAPAPQPQAQPAGPAPAAANPPAPVGAGASAPAGAGPSAPAGVGAFAPSGAGTPVPPAATFATPAPAQPPAAAPLSGRAPEGTAPGASVTAPVTAGQAAPPPAAAPPAAASADGTAAIPPGTRIVLKATADAWITLKQKGAAPLLNRTMHAGETFPVPPTAEGVTLTTGNAGATVLEVDGAPIPQSLGTPGMVRRDLPLVADDLKAGKLPAPKPRKVAPAPAG